MSVEITRSDRFVQWLKKNIENVREEPTSYHGFPITLDTKVRQYRTTISCIVMTFVFPSRLYIDGRDNHAIGFLCCTLSSFLFGWWGFPWGPIHTISALFGNLFGGSRETVSGLIDEITGHMKDVVQLTERGAAFARQRLLEQGHPPETALMIRIADEFGPEYEVEFDLPESDGRQWRSESHGITLLVDKREEEKLQGLVIDTEDGEFVFRR
jgi:hypothetical protein